MKHDEKVSKRNVITLLLSHQLIKWMNEAHLILMYNKFIQIFIFLFFFFLVAFILLPFSLLVLSNDEGSIIRQAIEKSA